ncbi:hypothetical protein F2Q68_00043371 [Brassica cretica]|uniref:Uncharacterized protein n=1 Tax=Brassica cretica TaxID=69181 RepID=A0A8S9LJC8_BRACR|nr:hypothetical protein F2Q68_00043371 [Brassica cretica]
MVFLLTGHETRTPGGLPIEPGTSWYLKSDYFKNRPSNWFYSYTSPDEIMLGSDLKQNLYCHLLCGLVQRDEVVRISSTFASGMVRVIKVLEDSWKELCLNIRSGYLSEWITDSGCRNAVSMVLGGQPRPNLSDEIESICSQKSWKGIMKKLWPQTKYIEAIVTGSMVQYIPMLEHYCSDLPVVSTIYASSESIFGINTYPLCKPEDISYTLMPNISYFEFIPMEGDNGDVLDLADVKLGSSYKLLVTNLWGLYRMRIGDMVKVTGFYNKAPQFRFLGRENALLSIDTDRTNEEYLFKAINRAKLWRFHSTDVVLVDHGVGEDTSLCSVIENHLKPGPWIHKLKPFCDVDLVSLKLFIRQHQKGAKATFKELDIKASLRQQLAKVAIVEYPVIHVYLPSQSYVFEGIRDFYHLNTTPDPNGSLYYSHGDTTEGKITSREEEIGEDGR